MLTVLKNMTCSWKIKSHECISKEHSINIESIKQNDTNIVGCEEQRILSIKGIS